MFGGFGVNDHQDAELEEKHLAEGQFIGPRHIIWALVGSNWTSEFGCGLSDEEKKIQAYLHRNTQYIDTLLYTRDVLFHLHVAYTFVNRLTLHFTDTYFLGG